VHRRFENKNIETSPSRKSRRHPHHSIDSNTTYSSVHSYMQAIHIYLATPLFLATIILVYAPHIFVSLHVSYSMR
jgi:hypothetical protein